MKPISVFGNLETSFASNGMAVLELAKDVTIRQEINGSYELSFNLPSCKKWQYVQEENIIKCGDELFRIIQINGHDVTARSVYFDAAYKHIQYLDDMIGMAPRDIVTNIFSGTKIHVMTAAEVAALGMEWVTEPTDFFETSKVTPIGCMDTLIKMLNKQKVNAELYIDNYKVAIVKSIGKWRGTRIDAQLNCRKNPEWQRDTQSIVTRLYPYGKDDLHIDSITAGNRQYIDSPNISKLGVKEGYAEFTEIEDPAELLQAAQWKFSEDNLVRVDVPKYAFDVDWVDIGAAPGHEGKHPVSLGDIVEIHDRDFDVISRQRVISMERYPYAPNKNKLTVGNPPKNLSQIMDNLIDGNAHYNKTTNGKGEVKTSWLEHMQRNETVSINNDLNSQDIALYKTGALWESPDGRCAVAIINGRLALSNSKRDGKWYWTTIADSGKIIVSEVFTGILYTEFVKLMGEGAQLEISNNMISFRATNGDIRSRWGYDNKEKYVFEIYNKSGKKVIYLNDDGKIEAVDIVAMGTFMTGKNGEDRTIIDGNGIYGFDGDGNRSGLWCNEKTGASPVGYADLTLYRSGNEIFKVYNDIGSISLYSYGTPFLTSRGSSSTALGVWTMNSNTRVETANGYINLADKISALERRIEELEKRPII